MNKTVLLWAIKEKLMYGYILELDGMQVGVGSWGYDIIAHALENGWIVYYYYG